MGTDLVALKAKLAEQAQVAVADLPPTSSGSFFSTKAGVLSLNDEQMPGNQVCVVIVDSFRENTYYAGEYDPNVVEAPTCYAFGRGGDEMAPHDSMAEHPDYFAPQNETCQGCPMNEWGSSDKGKGKACGNRMRLTLIPAGVYQPKRGSRDLDLELFTDPNDLAQVDGVFLKIPPTSVEEYAKYVQHLAAAHRLPPHAVVTRVYLEPHQKHQYHVKFEMVEEVTDALIEAVMARHDAATAVSFQGYRPPEETQKTAPAGGIRGLRRRA